MAFNKKEYDSKLKQWKVDLPIEEKEEYDKLLDEKNITKISFLRKAFKELKERFNIKQIENKDIKMILLLNDIVILFIKEIDDDFTKGKLSIRDVYMLLTNNYENLKLNEIETAIQILEDKKIITKLNEEYFLKKEK